MRVTKPTLFLLSLIFSFNVMAEECLTVVLSKETFGAEQFWMTKKANKDTKYFSVFLKSEGDIYHSDLFHCYKKKNVTHCNGDEEGGSLTLNSGIVKIGNLNLGVPLEKFIRFKGRNTPFKYQKANCPKRN